MEKDIRNKQGVYGVWVRDYLYVGSGFLGDRVSGNPSKLRRGVHENKQLQKAYNKIQDVKMEILDVCNTLEEAREMENVWIEHFKQIDGVIICNKYKAYAIINYERKLNEDDVREIKKLLEKGVKQKDLAEKYDVNPSVISRIKNGQRWSSVQI